jgi:pSer/pThr/pTyr-binding forkhead associated (FHA) protein
VTPHGGDTQAYLTFRDDPQREHYALSGSTIRIGRQRDNDLVLEDTSVSRHHAEVHVARDGSLSILDLDSLNGVFVNERQVKSARLNDGDSVEIGDVRLTLSLAAVAGPQRRQAPSALERTVIARTDDFFGGAQKP